MGLTRRQGVPSGNESVQFGTTGSGVGDRPHPGPDHPPTQLHVPCLVAPSTDPLTDTFSTRVVKSHAPCPEHWSTTVVLRATRTVWLVNLSGSTTSPFSSSTGRSRVWLRNILTTRDLRPGHWMGFATCVTLTAAEDLLDLLPPPRLPLVWFDEGATTAGATACAGCRRSGPRPTVRTKRSVRYFSPPPGSRKAPPYTRTLGNGPFIGATGSTDFGGTTTTSDPLLLELLPDPLLLELLLELLVELRFELLPEPLLLELLVELLIELLVEPLLLELLPEPLLLELLPELLLLELPFELLLEVLLLVPLLPDPLLLELLAAFTEVVVEEEDSMNAVGGMPAVVARPGIAGAGMRTDTCSSRRSGIRPNISTCRHDQVPERESRRICALL